MNTQHPHRPQPHRPAGYQQHPAHGPVGFAGQPAGWTYPHTPPARNGAGTAALVLGIVGVLVALVPLVGVIAWPLVAVGAVLGIVGLRRAARGQATNRGAALAGLLCSIAGAIVCVGYAVAFGQAADQAAASPDRFVGQADPSFSVTTPAPPATDPSPPAPDGSIAGAGTFLVGVDVEPGTYRSAGPDSDVMPWCYWSRLSNLDGTVDAIIANDGGDGPTLVTIRPGDAAFETSGCQTWQRVQ